MQTKLHSVNLIPPQEECSFSLVLRFNLGNIWGVCLYDFTLVMHGRPASDARAPVCLPVSLLFRRCFIPLESIDKHQ